MDFSASENSQNILILSMSTLPEKKATNYYCVAEKNEDEENIYRIFTGESQLEPGTKFFLTKLAEQGIPKDDIKIIVLATKETMDDRKESYENKTAVEWYCKNIRHFLTEGEEIRESMPELIEKVAAKLTECAYQEPQFLALDDKIKELYGSEAEEIEPEQVGMSWCDLNQYLDVGFIRLDHDPLQEIMGVLNESTHDGNTHLNLFIDLQGGSRTFMFTLFATMTLLRDRNATIKEMFAINFDRANMIHPIESVADEYAIIDLVSGIRAFTRYGKVEELKHFLDKRKTVQRERELLAIMEDIDGCMQINNPEGFTTELAKLSENDSTLLNKNSYSDPQFKLIVEDLKDTYYPILQKDASVLNQIQWFGEKAFITSALTFIEDKIPGFMIGEGVNSIIRVSYSSQMTQNEVSWICGGKPYYRKENNIFNRGFQKLLVKEEKKYYQKICDFWAEKLVAAENALKLRIKCGEALTVKYNENSILSNSELYSALFKIGNELGDDLWKDITLKALCRMIFGSHDENNWNTFKREAGKRGVTISKNKEAKLEKAGLTPEKIESLCKIKNAKKVITIATWEYLKGKDYNFDYKDDRDRKILIECISGALYTVIFEWDGNKKDEKDKKDKLFDNMISDVLERLNNDLIDISSYKENPKELFVYELWKDLISFSTNIKKGELEDKISKYAISENTKKEAELVLKELCEEIDDVKTMDIDRLLKFAKTYVQCRDAIEALTKEKGLRVEDSNNSYKNLGLYVELNDKFKKIYQDYFYIDENGQRFYTVAGIRNEKKMVFKGGQNKKIQINITGNSPDDRVLLDVCIRFYQALKKERNATNHAAESSSNHMNYRYTQKAIFVFVELCRRLEKSIQQKSEK